MKKHAQYNTHTKADIMWLLVDIAWIVVATIGWSYIIYKFLG